MRVVFYRGVVAPIENVATTVNDVDSAADWCSWLQWISGMQAPCARAPEGAMERNKGPSLTAIASSENRFSPTATHRRDHSNLRIVITDPTSTGRPVRDRGCKVLEGVAIEPPFRHHDRVTTSITS
ncbi:hypothetical protein [Stenotrophomonas maltophilia]|uniref:hypothetical protein n=1 Tax=Stenotrophomonas maltophilia TaxID=40324 RepID=UPI00115C9E8E|nr:hypothetical protein [Stenotrophomonas maltophilia]